MSPAKPIKLLRVAEVAEMLSVSETQVRAMRLRGQLPPPSKIPGLGLRWTQAALEAWLAKQVVSYPEDLPSAHIPNGKKGPHFKRPR